MTQQTLLWGSILYIFLSGYLLLILDEGFVFMNSYWIGNYKTDNFQFRNFSYFASFKTFKHNCRPNNFFDVKTTSFLLSYLEEMKVNTVKNTCYYLQRKRGTGSVLNAPIKRLVSLLSSLWAQDSTCHNPYMRRSCKLLHLNQYNSHITHIFNAVRLTCSLKGVSKRCIKVLI